jgi:hypothetical protein
MDREAESLLNSNYGWFKQPIADAQISYRIIRAEASEGFLLSRKGACTQLARDDGAFLYMLEKDITIETQKLRPDLYFVHAAVLEVDGHAVVLVGPSGYGKSTMTWGLLHHGFNYLSDELAPVDLTMMRVHPFPHALCLKAIPPDRYPLPERTIYTRYTVHVPTECLPCDPKIEMMPLQAIFFVRFINDISEPVLRPLGKADAAVRLFTNTLNPLAHPAHGLDGAIDIVLGVQCFELLSSDLQLTCELIKSTLSSTLC